MRWSDASMRTGRVPGDDASRTADSNADAHAEHVLWLLHSHRGDAAQAIDRLLADEPRSTFGHCLRAAHIVCSDTASGRSQLEESIAVIEAAVSNEAHPARRHAAAARAWLEQGPARALDRYGAIVIDRPLDILALTTAHALDFRLGRRRMLRDRVAQVLREWDSSQPGYASVLSMYAFGLVENGEHRRAEKTARRALAFDPGHPGAIHAMAHVMEMRGRAREGLALLTATESQWLGKTGFSVHLAWHRALFHLDLEERRAALAVYDRHIVNARTPNLSALADASALLWRLRLRDIDVGARWHLLADRWEAQTLINARPFFAVHAMMAFAAAGRDDAVDRVLDALRNSTANATPLLAEESLAVPLCESLVDFARGKYAACVEQLARVRDVAHRCGGSLAQCDIVHLTLTEAALRARKASLARALVAERAAQKPASRFNRRLIERIGTMTPAMA